MFIIGVGYMVTGTPLRWRESLATPATPSLGQRTPSAQRAVSTGQYLSRGGELGGKRESVVHAGVGQVVVQVLNGALAGDNGLCGKGGQQRNGQQQKMEGSTPDAPAASTQMPSCSQHAACMRSEH